MTELENMTLGEWIGVLRERIERSRFTEETARRERENAEAALATVEAALRGPQAITAPESEGKRVDGPALLGLAAVRQVIREEPDRTWTPREVHEILEQRGWLSGDAKYPKAGTESAVGRLLKKGDIVKVARGRYRWRGEQEALTEN